MRINLFARIALFAVLAAIGFCYSTSPDDAHATPLIPGQWSLVYTTQGDAYVQDFNLSADDCRTFRNTASKTTNHTAWTCEIQ